MLTSRSVNFSSKKMLNNGCLKSSKAKVNRIKKSVHFDRNSPIEIDSSPTSVIVTSSSLSTVNDEKKKNDDDDDGETVKEKEKIETTRRTIICSPTTTSSSLTTHTIHRSFSLSPSPLFKEEENNSNRRHRQVKKENVDELNCTTTSNSSSSRRVTFNDHLSPTKKANGMNNFNGSMNDRCLSFFSSSF